MCMCGVLPDPRGEGEISRYFSLLSLSYACKELLSDMMIVKPEFIHRWPRDSSVISIFALDELWSAELGKHCLNNSIRH